MNAIARFLIYERTVVFVIVLNTLALITMGYTDPELNMRGMSTDVTRLVHRVASYTDYGCVGYFIVELTIKVGYDGFKTFWKNPWNRFDVVVVVLSAPVLLSPWLPVRELSTFLALRLGRLFRLFRVMRFIPNREHLYKGVKRALRASVGVFLALLLINIVLAIGATQLFGRIAPEHFGDPALSSYSLFRVFTIEGWHEIPDVIAQRSHWAMGLLARLYFVMSVMVGGILGLSLANAVFVDEMTTDNTAGLENKIDLLTDEVRRLRAEMNKR